MFLVGGSPALVSLCVFGPRVFCGTGLIERLIPDESRETRDRKDLPHPASDPRSHSRLENSNVTSAHGHLVTERREKMLRSKGEDHLTPRRVR